MENITLPTPNGFENAVERLVNVLPNLMPFVFVIILMYIFVRIVNRRASRKKAHYKKIVEQLKAYRRAKQAELDRQQLTKPAFQTRLRKFKNSTNSVVETNCENKSSQMPFWQAEDLQPKYSPPRPIEFIRTILWRLAKLAQLS